MQLNLKWETQGNVREPGQKRSRQDGDSSPCVLTDKLPFSDLKHHLLKSENLIKKRKCSLNIIL